MVTANNYMFRPLTGHHKVLHLLYIYIYIYIEQTMVAANNYMFRPLTGHHQVLHPMKRVEGLYNMSSDRSYIVYCTAPQTLFIGCTT